MAWFAPGAQGHFNNLISADNPGQTHFLLAERTNKGLSILAGHSGGTSQFTDIAVAVTAKRGVWVNIALVYDATLETMTIYVNGVAAGSAGQIAPATPLSGTTTVTIGGYGSAGGGTDGKIGRARIWTQALSAAQISTIVTHESGGLAGF
jgi:hypothetical protein